MNQFHVVRKICETGLSLIFVKRGSVNKLILHFLQLYTNVAEKEANFQTTVVAIIILLIEGET